MKLSRNLQELLALTGFLALIGGAALWTFVNFSLLSDQRSALDLAQASLASLNAHQPAHSAAATPQQADPPGSPFLEGDTLTVAGAQLQSGMISLIQDKGGFVTSSQLDLQNEKTDEKHIRLTMNFEISPDKVQSLLYGIEAGLPYLFIEEFSLTAPESDGPMKASLSVSGFWGGAKP